MCFQENHIWNQTFLWRTYWTFWIQYGLRRGRNKRDQYGQQSWTLQWTKGGKAPGSTIAKQNPDFWISINGSSLWAMQRTKTLCIIVLFLWTRTLNYDDIYWLKNCRDGRGKKITLQTNKTMCCETSVSYSCHDEPRDSWCRSVWKSLWDYKHFNFFKPYQEDIFNVSFCWFKWVRPLFYYVD